MLLIGSSEYAEGVDGAKNDVSAENIEVGVDMPSSSCSRGRYSQAVRPGDDVGAAIALL